MMICNMKVLNYIKYNRHCLSTTSRRVQSELNKILTAQAIVPVLTALLPITLEISGAFTDLDLVFASFISGILYLWIPIGNAICVLFFVTAYRMKLKQLFFCIRPKLPRLFSNSGVITVS